MNKLVSICVDNHKYPRGTILSVISETKSELTCAVAEKGNHIKINKVNVREL